VHGVTNRGLAYGIFGCIFATYPGNNFVTVPWEGSIVTLQQVIARNVIGKANFEVPPLTFGGAFDRDRVVQVALMHRCFFVTPGFGIGFGFVF
jgi:hypothetical protein